MNNPLDPDYLDEILSQNVSPETFLGWLSRGLGRAVLYLKQHDSAPYMDAITQACITNLVYDPQVEGSRALYLMAAIDASDHFSYFADAVLKAFEQEIECEGDRWQVGSLVCLLAKRSYLNAEQLLFTVAENRVDIWSYVGLDEMLAVNDRKAAALYADHILTCDYTHEKKVEEFDDMISALARFYKDFDDKGFNWQSALLEVSPQVSPYIPEIEQKIEVRCKLVGSSRRSERTYEEIKAMLVEPPTNQALLFFRGVGRNVKNKETLLKLADDFLIETAPDVLHRYIALFSERRCPRGFARFIPYLTHKDSRVARLAVKAVAQFRHRSIRAIGLQFIENGQEYEGVELLARNFAEEDLETLCLLTSNKAPADIDHHHWLDCTVTEMWEETSDMRILPAVLNVYSNGPCSFCRETIVRHMEKINALPDWIARERQFDSQVLGDE